MKIEIAILHNALVAHDVYHGMKRRWAGASVSVQPDAERFSVKVDGEEVDQSHAVRIDAHHETVDALRIMSA